MSSAAQQQSLLTPPPTGDYVFTSNSILPAPVNASSINKGGNVSVNLATGTPNTSISLTEVKSRYLGFPITVNYTSNGIKVDELSSTVGIGWSLNCGGAVTRTTLGLPDEERAIYNSDYTNFTKTSLTNFDRPTLNYLQYKRDRESDIFDFSVSGFISGKFILDSLGKPLSLGADRCKISLISNNLHDGFLVIDEKGIEYLFNVADTSFFNRTGVNCPDDGRDRNTEVVNAWNISSIIMPGKDTIRFQYMRTEDTYVVDVNELESICVNSTSGSCPGGSQSYACQVYSSDYTLCRTSRRFMVN